MIDERILDLIKQINPKEQIVEDLLNVKPFPIELFERIQRVLDHDSNK